MIMTKSRVTLLCTRFSLQSFHVPAHFLALPTALVAYTFSIRSQELSYHLQHVETLHHGSSP
jgi:hypothetical protein